MHRCANVCLFSDGLFVYKVDASKYRIEFSYNMCTWFCTWMLLKCAGKVTMTRCTVPRTVTTRSLKKSKSQLKLYAGSTKRVETWQKETEEKLLYIFVRFLPLPFGVIDHYTVRLRHRCYAIHVN